MARLREFWQGWHKEIIRGGLIFSAVVFIGLAATRMVGWLPLGIAQGLGNLENMDWDHNGGGDRGDRGDRGRRDWQEAYRWAGPIKASHWVWIRNTNGPVEVEPSEGDSLIVYADKASRHGNPDDVEIRVVEHDGTVTLCALWSAAVMECGAEGVYRMKGQKKSDVAVRFRVQLPRGVKLDASTLDGPVDVEGAHSALVLGTVNGRIRAATDGPLRAVTVHGGIEATLSGLGDVGPIELLTENGGIVAEFAEGFDADVDASTQNGRVSSELPLELVGRVSQQRLKARLGAGGRAVRLKTQNGGITIRQASDHDGHDPHRTQGRREEVRVRVEGRE